MIMTTLRNIASISTAALAGCILLASTGVSLAHAGPGGLGHVHGPGSSHNPIVYHPVHGPGSSHNPIVVHVRDHRRQKMTFCQLEAAGVQVRDHRKPSYRGGHPECRLSR